MASTVSEITFLEGNEFPEASVLLMCLMEESKEDDHEYCGDDHRLISFMKSLEAEISGTNEPHLSFNNGFDFKVSEEGQDFSQGGDHDYGWVDMEVVSSSPMDDQLINNMGEPYGEMRVCVKDYSTNYPQYYPHDQIFNYGVAFEEESRNGYVVGN